MITLITTTESSNGTSDLASNITGSSSCVNGSTRTSTKEEEDHTQLDAFLYIIIVLSFYAISMVLLMIKYIRREEEEMYLDFYYTEFVSREHFQNPRVKNRLALEREKRRLNRILLSVESRDIVVTSDNDETNDLIITSDTNETKDCAKASFTNGDLDVMGQKEEVRNHVMTSYTEDSGSVLLRSDPDGLSFPYRTLDTDENLDLVEGSDQEFVTSDDNDHDTSDFVLNHEKEETTV